MCRTIPVSRSASWSWSVRRWPSVASMPCGDPAPAPQGPSWWSWPTAPRRTSSTASLRTRTSSWSSTRRISDLPPAAIRLRPSQGPPCSSSSMTTARCRRGCIDALVRAVSDDPEIGAVGARILWADGTLQEAGSVLWRDGHTVHVGEGLPPGSDAYQEPRHVDFASANGLLVTRRAWEVVGGFDERYFPAYYEDVDLCLALAAQGFATRYEPQARLVHQRKPEFVEGLSRLSLDSEPAEACREMGSGPRPFRVSAPEGVWTRLRRRRAAGDQSGRCGRDARRAPRRVRRTVENQRCPAPADFARAAADLAADYHAYLEQRVLDQERRIIVARDLSVRTVGSSVATLGGESSHRRRS